MLSATLITNGKGGGATNSFNTASITPVRNRLYLAFVFQDSDTTNQLEPTVSGGGISWATAVTRQNGSDAHQRASIIRGMGQTPSAGALTINTNANCGSIFWAIVEVNYVKRGGTAGSNAVVQTGSQSSDTTDPLNNTITLGAFASSLNGTFWGGIGPDVLSTPSGFTSLVADNQDLGPDNNIRVAWRNDNATSINTTSTGSGARVATTVAAEVAFKLYNAGNAIFHQAGGGMGIS